MENVVDDNIIRLMRTAWKINNAACTARMRKTDCFPLPAAVTRTHLITYIGTQSVFLNLICFACFKQASSSITCILGAFADLQS